MKICLLEDCGRKHYSKGYCRAHYDRLRRKGTLVGFIIGNTNISYSTPEEALKARTEWQGDCLVWTGSLKPNGYGQININGVVYYVHRYVWEKSNGPVPKHLELDHKCHNTACVNLNHLRLATHSQNTAHRRGGWGKTGIKNVQKTAAGNYRVIIAKNKVRYNLGTYETLEEASEVARVENLKLNGEFSI